MTPWDASREAFGPCRKAVAAAFDRSVELIDRWCEEPEPLGTGCPSPLDRIEIALHAGGPNAQRVVLDYLCGRFGFLPVVKAEDVDAPASLEGAADLMKQVAEVLERYATIGDGITRDEAEALRRELADVLRVCSREHRAVLRLIDADEERSIAQRVGPRRAPRVIAVRRLTA